MAQFRVDNFEAGSPIEGIAENYPTVLVENIRKLIAYATRTSRNRGERDALRQGYSGQAPDASTRSRDCRLSKDGVG